MNRNVLLKKVQHKSIASAGIGQASLLSENKADIGVELVYLCEFLFRCTLFPNQQPKACLNLTKTKQET
jgi:hypothetical protein